MRKLFTILLACIALVSFAQRSEVFEDKSFGAQSTRVVLDNDTTILWPGNSEADGNTFHQYWFGAEGGYIFGTNTYGDTGYGQEYVVDEPYNVAGALFWIAGHAGSDGYVIFQIIDMSAGTPGDILHEQYVFMDELWGTTSLAEAYTIFFTDFDGNPTSIPVTNNYLMAIDITNLGDYEYDVAGETLIYGLGNVSTGMGQGGANFLGWVKEDTGEWVNVENYGAAGWDTDIMILIYAVPYDDDNGDPDDTFTVTFHVKDEDGDPIDNATIVLGPFTNDEGDYVFHDVPEGTHEYTVTAPGFMTVVDNVTVTEDMDVEVEMEETEVTYYEVTFNVDMNDVEGFDPADHHVFMTGTFTGWAEPGSAGSLQLELVVPAKTIEELVIFEEDFSPAIESPVLPEGWHVMKADNALGNNLQELGEDDQRWIRYSELYYPYASFNPAWVHSGEAAMHCNWNVQAVQNAYAISPYFEIPEANAVLLEFWKFFVHNIDDGWLTHFNLLLELDGEWMLLQEFTEEDGANMYEEPVFVDLTGHQGTARLAWVLKWTDGIQMTIDTITVTAYGVEDDNGDPDPDPEDLIYTVTTHVPEGVAAYKYFSDAFGAGWGGGEWDGDPNRELMIEGDWVQDDVWGVYEPPVSVVEVEQDKPLTLYPNPASSILNLSADVKHLAVYDITGRMLIELHNTNVVNVSDLRNGLYIIQVTTPNGTEAHRFHVAR